MSGSNYQANASTTNTMQTLSIQQGKWLLYILMLHNEDGSIATDENGNSYDINNYKYLWTQYHYEIKMILIVKNVML